MDLWQIVKRIATGILRRRKLLLLLTLLGAAAVAAPLAYYVSKEPPRYRTAAMILLESRAERVSIFQQQQEQSPLSQFPVQLAILRSQSVAEGVLYSLPKASFQDLIDNPYYVDYMLVIKNAYRRVVGLEPEVESPQRRALKELQLARVSFDPRVHGLVNIIAEASKPQVAVDIASTYVEVLLSRTRSFNLDDARTSREAVEQQLGEVRKNLKASEDALAGFTASHGGVKIPDRSQAEVARLSQTQNALAEVRANKKIVETRFKSLREKLESRKGAASSAEPAPSPPPGPPAPEIQRLREQLVQLEKALLDLRTKYTDEHPRVVLIKDRIAEVQRQLGDVIMETNPPRPAPGAVPSVDRAPFGAYVVAMEATLHALSAQEEALRGQAEALQQTLSGLSKSELEYTRLVREVDSNRNLYTILSEKLTAARIREQGDMKFVKVIDPPSVPMPATSERRLKIFGLALVLVLVIGAAVPGTVEWARRYVESEEDVRATTGFPVLGMVPRLRSGLPLYVSGERSNGGTPHEDGFLFAEAFQNLRVAIQLAMRMERLRTVLIASAFPDEGKSTIVVNLGLAFREAGRSVVLADTDFYRPTLHQTMKVPQNGGLADVLRARRGLDESLSRVAKGLWLAPAGRALQPQSRGLLATGRLKELLEGMAAKADLVLCDSSPILLVPDNLFLASAVDGVLLVVKAGSTGCRDLARAKSLLEGVGARIVGVVINEIPVSVLRRYYRRYYKAYLRSDAR